MKNNKSVDLKYVVCGKYLTISAFADKVGWSRQKMSDTINGRRMPSLQDMADMAAALETTIDHLSTYFLQ